MWVGGKVPGVLVTQQNHITTSEIRIIPSLRVSLYSSVIFLTVERCVEPTQIESMRKKIITLGICQLQGLLKQNKQKIIVPFKTLPIV